MVPSEEFCRFQHIFPREPLSYIATDSSRRSGTHTSERKPPERPVAPPPYDTLPWISLRIRSVLTVIVSFRVGNSSVGVLSVKFHFTVRVADLFSLEVAHAPGKNFPPTTAVQSVFLLIVYRFVQMM